MKKNIIYLSLIIININVLAQNKKEQIQILSNKIDSLNMVLKSNNIKFTKDVDSLKTINLSIKKKYKESEFALEKNLKQKTDSLDFLKNINKYNLLNINKQKDLIELFNNSLSIEKRDFDLYKDSKLFAQIFFLQGIYHFDKVDGSFASTYYGVVLANRLINIKLTENEKQIFYKEFLINFKYIIENYTNSPPEINKFINNLENTTDFFDSIVSQLNMVRTWFEPYNFNEKYYLINDIERILKKSIYINRFNLKLNLN